MGSQNCRPGFESGMLLFAFFTLITGKNIVAFTGTKPLKITGNIYQIFPVISTGMYHQ